MTLPALLDASPQSFVARNQNDVAATIGPAVMLEVFAFATGCEMSPRNPSYHCSVIGCDPATPAASVIVSPLTACPPFGCTMIFGATHGTTVIVIVSARANAPQLFAASSQ